MSFSKGLVLVSIFACLGLKAQEQNTQSLPDMVEASTQRALAQAKEMGWLDDVKKYQQVDEKQVQEIKKLTDKSRVLVSNTLVKEFEFTEDMADSIAGLNNAEKSQKATENAVNENAALLVSLSMPEKLLISAMRMSEREKVPLYLNGWVKGTTSMQATYNRLKVISNKAGVEPFVSISPLPFREYNVTVVPAVIVRKEDRTAIKYGMLKVPYVIEQAEEYWETETDKLIELPQVGKLFSVEEIDLIEQMKDRFAGIDWEDKQRKAKDRFWNNVTLYGLPEATEDKTWFIDPTVHVTKDIKNPEGEIIARAGETKNPLKEFPMKMTYFIVDPSNEKQVTWLKGKLRNISGQFQVMITHLDKKRGWEHFTEIRKTFNTPIFVMPKEVIERFHVQAAPTQVSTTTDAYLKVEQVYLEGLSQ